MPDLSGQSIDRYHIIEPLGEGGMATVYKAFDTRLETDVAIKVIRTDRFTPEMLSEALKRFEREAKSLARLTHPNIVKVTDYGEYEGQPYLVMVYLPGGTLKERLGKPMPWSEAARILVPIADALGFAHQQGIVHRDIKPSNILITESGKPMLSDFGVAKIIGNEAGTGLTGTGMAVGTPEYMAPEQVNAKTADGRADIYALGIVFYEMVTGRRPFQADTPLAVLFKHLTDPLPRPREFVPGLPDAVENLLFKALTKKPEDRYQTMGEFAAALEKITAGEQPAAVSEKKEKKLEEKRESLEKTAAPMVATAFARPAPSPKGEAIKPDMEEATLHTPAKQEKPVEAKKPARPVRSFKLLIPIGILIVVLGIGIPFGIRYLRPAVETKTPGGIAADTDTATSAPPSTVTQAPALSPTATAVPSTHTASGPTPSMGSTWTRPADGMVMVYVPAGEFTMGVSDGNSDEQPVHNVYIDAFWMDQTEVTNKMYAMCVVAGKCDPPNSSASNLRSRYYDDPDYADYPVIYVSWNDASNYCAWIGGGTDNVRLPTEAEWEKAARGADGRIYPWGAQIDCQKANYLDGNNYCIGDTSRVGSYENGKGPYGAYDMAGNVWEWVSDWYGLTYYSSSPLDNPTGPISGDSRVLRGGAWGSNADGVRVATRLKRSSSFTFSNIGFRCARSAESASEVINTPAPTTTTETTLGVGSTWTRPADNMVMVRVTEGEFTMGAGEGVGASSPAHKVYLDEFWIDRTEVTNAMYALCVKAGSCKPPSQSSSATHSRYYGDFNYDNFPVIYVSWNDADAYCRWARARLPTDAEWEKSARGTDDRTYPWGSEEVTCSLANYWQGIGIGFCVGDTVAVGSFPDGASPYGALDMAGNAYEWVADWFSKTYYSYSPQRNPSGPNTGEYRVIRGGGWQDDGNSVTNRNWRDPNGGINYVGFRCAVSSVSH